MHHIYHTEGIILSSKNYGEAGKYYAIFTRDLGMIYASAQGVRKMSSKLRYVLQDFSYIKVDLVKGKDFWRVTSASKTNDLEKVVRNKNTFEVFSNISRLLKRLLSGEEPNTSLFHDLVKGLSILDNMADVESRDTAFGDYRNMEAIIVLRILNNLGYIGDSVNLDTLIQSPFEHELVLEVSKNRKEILNHINKALKETHL
jgi:DNA repair protein RecO